MAGKRFGPWLASELAGRDMTQAELARKMETSTGAVSSWIHGTRHPTPASCRKIASVLRLPVDVVLTAAGHRPVNGGEVPPEVAEVAEMMKAMPEDQRAEVVAFVRWRMERMGMREVSDWSLTVGAAMLWGILLWGSLGSLDSSAYWRLYGIGMLLLALGVVTRIVLGAAWVYRKMQGR